MSEAASGAIDSTVKGWLELALKALSRVEAPDWKGEKRQVRELVNECGEYPSMFAMAQPELRQRAMAKFRHPEPMLFQREALEQATHWKVAEYHAALFPFDQLVFDVTAGIGGDLSELARRGPVVGFEKNPERMILAQYNLRVLGLSGEVGVRDALELEPDTPYIWADPHRRDAEGRRVVEPADYSPDPTELIARFKSVKRMGIKLSPLLADHFLQELAEESRVEFVSYDGECREVVVWVGSDVVPGWGAVRAETGEFMRAHPITEFSDELGVYLYDADPAAVRAHVLGGFGLAQLGDANGYLTGNTEIFTPWLSRYEVLYGGKGDFKTTREACRRLGVRVFEVKKRGVPGDGQKIQREFSKLEGDPVSLVVWPVGKSLRHGLVRRVSD